MCAISLHLSCAEINDIRRNVQGSQNHSTKCRNRQTVLVDDILVLKFSSSSEFLSTYCRAPSPKSTPNL